MSMRMVGSLTLCLSLGAGAPALAIDKEVLVGGTQGVAKKGDPLTGNYQFLGTCGGPIDSMVLANQTLYLGAQNGIVYVYSMTSQSIQGSYSVGMPISAMTAHGDDLLVSNISGTIKRINPANGQVKATYNGGVQTRAMIQLDGMLYVGGLEGAVHRADATTGQFSYFTCFCNGPILSLAADAQHLYVGDENGSVFFFNRITGQIVSGFWTGAPVTGMAIDGDEALISDDAGNVQRVDKLSGQPTATFPTGLSNVQSLVLRITNQCVADINGDGFVDGMDSDQFVNSFESGVGAVDLNDDGFSDGMDYDIFMNHFAIGC